MKFYIAGAFQDYERVRAFQKQLWEHYHQITFDWTDGIVDLSGPTDSKLTSEQRARFAMLDRDGVINADCVVVLTPADKAQGCGMWVELGMAIAFGKRVIVAGPQAHRTIFTEFCERFDTDAEALQAALTR